MLEPYLEASTLTLQKIPSIKTKRVKIIGLELLKKNQYLFLATAKQYRLSVLHFMCI